MGNSSSFQLQREEIQKISIETGFTSGQIKRLYGRFTSLDKNNAGYLRREDFTRIPELHINPLRDRIVDVLLNDYGNDEKMNFVQFARLFSTFRRPTGKQDENDTNSKENKLKFLFDVYDRDKDNKISKAELLAILNLLVGANLPEEQMNAIAERTIAELGPDAELQSCITFQNFCDTLKKIDIEDKMSMKFLS